MSDQLPILTRKKLQPKGPKPEDMVARPTENEEMREKEPPLAFEDFPVNKSINDSPSKPIEDPKETIREIEEGSKGGPNEPRLLTIRRFSCHPKYPPNYSGLTSLYI
jgi:hypothetical protein